jgi:hypothetical protein
MDDPRPACVVTTVQPATPSVRRLAEALTGAGMDLVVVGDRKGPTDFDCLTSEFLTIHDQLELAFELAPKLPENHYVRKNLGYLVAIKSGAPFLYETDDDNAPLEDWRPRSRIVSAEPIESRDWANAYRIFDPSPVIWPRGFPLDRVLDPKTYAHQPAGLTEYSAPIQQGLANGSPDVDAVWRLVIGGAHSFPARGSIWLPEGTWCPFNSQSTWWWPEAYPLLY